MKRIALLLLMAMTSGMPAQTAAPKAAADVIFTHGNVYTGLLGHSLGAGKRAEAIAIRGDQILAVGTRDDVMKMKGPDTKVVDLDGHFVMPGFNDAHMHLARAGLEKLTVEPGVIPRIVERKKGVPRDCLGALYDLTFESREISMAMLERYLGPED